MTSRFSPALAAVIVLAMACKSGTPSVSPSGSAEPMPAASSVPTPSSSSAASPADDEARARRLIEALARGDLGVAPADFDGAMQAALPKDKLGAIFPSLTASAGAFKSIDRAETKIISGHPAVLLTCSFAKAALVARVVFGPDHRIAGLNFAPGEAAASWSPPSYADTTRLTERDVALPGTPSLPGTLTVPAGAGPFPAVVLVHGSGPSDADESVGGAKVFKDLAWGLASKGIVVLRYVKRTRHAPEGVVGIKEEVLDGARAAFELAKSTAPIDPKRVVVVGHSQGAELAPRIASENGAAGVVMMASPSRPFQDVVLDQITYLASLKPGPESAHVIEQAHAFKAALDDPALKPDAEVVFPGAGALKGAYFLSMRGYDPVKAVAALKVPVLILQGARDYQVTAAKDFEGFKKAFANKPGVTLKQYPGLTHLFTFGTGESRPAEYEAPAHVDPQVVTDIAAFVTAIK